MTDDWYLDKAIEETERERDREIKRKQRHIEEQESKLTDQLISLRNEEKKYGRKIRDTEKELSLVRLTSSKIQELLNREWEASYHGRELILRAKYGLDELDLFEDCSVRNIVKLSETVNMYNRENEFDEYSGYFEMVGEGYRAEGSKQLIDFINENNILVNIDSIEAFLVHLEEIIDNEQEVVERLKAMR